MHERVINRMMLEKTPNQRGQIFSVEDGIVVVEWYSFGDDVAYEFAKQVRFDPAGQAQFAVALGFAEAVEPSTLASILKDRFGSYWAVREFADANGIPYAVKTDMQP